ncbi:MAG: hypothetical protein QW416_09320 [Candidatus Nitrosocaldaceae archaeon]
MDIRDIEGLLKIGRYREVEGLLLQDAYRKLWDLLSSSDDKVRLEVVKYILSNFGSMERIEEQYSDKVE